MTIHSVCVCGAGTMGSGIAQVAATAGFRTVLYELNEAVLRKAEASIRSGLSLLQQKGKIPAGGAEEIYGRILFTSKIEEAVADLVIEAIVEIPAAKINLFRQLAGVNRKETLFVSNTSSLSITGLAQELDRAPQFAGLHFFNPAPVMKLVEVVRGEETTDEVIAALTHFTRALGKVPVVCRDAPGFIVNRVARPYYIESLRLAEEGEVPLETIDRLLENRGFKMGPFKLMDLIGNDINYAVSCSVFSQLGEPERLKPSHIQKEKVEKGDLGRKTGRGYYNYNGETK